MLEVRLPISPRPAWLNRVQLIAASVRRWYPDAIVTVSCYPSCATDIEGLLWRWVKDNDFNAWAGTRSEYLATVMDTWKPPFRGDHILHLDADVIPIRRFDELFDGPWLQGVQAHHSPYGRAGWESLFRLHGLPPPRMDIPYSGWGSMFNDEAQRFGPFYPNSGVVFGPRALFEQLAEPYAQAVEDLRGYITDTYWFDQLGLALAIAAAALPVRALPLRYNFPNRPAFECANPTELKEMTFCHFMQTDGGLHRDRDFESPAALDTLCARTDLTGANEAVRAWVAEIRGEAGL
jgi:hypothetical protein